MAEQGYPILRERNWAKARSRGEVLAEAERTNSTALWAIGLERVAAESDDPDAAVEAALNLSRLAWGCLNFCV